MLTDEIRILSPSNPDRKLLIFFITGNPGLIGYYGTFLSYLNGILCDRKISTSHVVYGASLDGFEVSQRQHHSSRTHQAERNHPLNLEQQIEAVQTRLRVEVQTLNDKLGDQSTPVEVVLIGHSVGAYILLELLSKWHRARQQKSGDSTGDLPQPESAHPVVKLLGGVCLFPTVTDLAKSPSGRLLGPLFSLPYFPVVVHYLVKCLFGWMPAGLLLPLVRMVTGMPTNGATTTAAFLQSKRGVQQAIYLAKHELVDISTDRWSDDLWGVTKSNTESQMNNDRTKLFFYFGEQDHWVANRTRDELIAARASTGRAGDEDKPFMEVDRGGMPHGFCIRHSEPVAEKAAEYIERILTPET